MIAKFRPRCLLILAMISCPFGGMLAAEGNEVAEAPYVIQPSDVLEVFVWNETDLSRDVIVRPDGKISFPLVQDIQAAGLTPLALKRNIETELGAYLSDPNVTVIVKEIRHYQVFVTGMVNAPGSFTSPTPLSVLQALALAGGFQQFADKSGIGVVRSNGNTPETIKFRYGDVVKGNNPRYRDFLLQSGDVVVVPGG